MSKTVKIIQKAKIYHPKSERIKISEIKNNSVKEK
jgi:hypothetical protein